MNQAASLLATDLVVAYMLTMAALYGLIDTVFVFLQTRALVWKQWARSRSSRSSLDAPTRRNLQDELTRLWKEHRKTILFVTHDMEEAIYFADRVIALGGSPARVVASVPVTLARLRRRDDPVLVELVASMIATLHAESTANATQADHSAGSAGKQKWRRRLNSISRGARESQHET
jgi:ABC-type multidrug transport system ATPase subunit